MKQFNGITLKEQTNSKKNIFEVRLQADSNDADYVYNTITFNEEELDLYLPAIKVILKGNVNGWGEIRNDPYYLTPPFEDTVEDILAQIVPYSEWGVHSVNIKSFVYYDENHKVWDVKVL